MEDLIIDPSDWVSSTSIVDALISAPPGCGKTELLARRAEFLVRCRELNFLGRFLRLHTAARQRPTCWSVLCGI